MNKYPASSAQSYIESARFKLNHLQPYRYYEPGLLKVTARNLHPACSLVLPNGRLGNEAIFSSARPQAKLSQSFIKIKTMDPLSATASAVTVVGLLSQSCLFVFDFLRNFSDASFVIKNHYLALQALHADLRKIQDLHTKNPSLVELTPQFSVLIPEMLADFTTVEAKLRKIRGKLGEGKGTKAWARVTWSLSSEQWLDKFLSRVQTYHAIFSSELMLVLMSALTMEYRLTSWV